MTLQDDLARHWFQPLVPLDAQKEPDAQEELPRKEWNAGMEPARPEAGPMTTRIAGELALDEAPAAAYPPHPAPASPASSFAPITAPPPVPERVEVTQPFIPAIRDEQPEFAKRLSPSAPPAAPSSPPPTQPPGSATAPVQPLPAENPQAKPKPKRKSLARRVVRRIIGPDLLRKDPPKKRR